MIRSVRGNLLTAEADALVNTVGVMGTPAISTNSRYVELAELICPGCGEPVNSRLPPRRGTTHSKLLPSRRFARRSKAVTAPGPSHCQGRAIPLISEFR